MFAKNLTIKNQCYLPSSYHIEENALKMILTASLFGTQQEKDSCRKKQESSLVKSFRTVLNEISIISNGWQVAESSSTNDDRQP